MSNNPVCWFEIPVTDMDRAKSFYEAIFNISISVQDFQGTLMGWFPFDAEKPGISGSLIKNEAYRPSETHGALIYFESDDIEAVLSKAKANGGRIWQEKQEISPEHGHMGVFIDSEGNRIALYTSARS